MEKNTNKPSIRFAEFTDAWEQRKLGDNIVEYMEVTTQNNQYPPLTSSRKGIFFQTEYFAGNQIASANNTGYNIVPYGYFTYRHMSDDEIFHFNINDIVEKGIVSTLYPVFTTNENLNSRYLQYQLNYGHEFAKFAVLQKQGGSRTYMYLSKLKQLYITIPKSIKEQKAISTFFTNLDHLITLHQRECDQLRNIKKALLEKMFPSQNEYTPRIRFKCFTDAWEQRKLGDVVQITMGQSPDGSTYSDEPSDYILVQGNADLQNGWVCPRIWTTQITKKADAGDLIMSVRAPAGATGKTAYNAVIGRGVAAIKGNEFIYQLLVKMDTDGFWKTLSCGSTFESLNSDNIKNAEVKIPTTAEQIKIGGLFQYLDNIITLHQRKCEKLNNIKKSLLEKMFA